MLRKLLATAMLLFGISCAHAELQIDITGGINAGHKIAVYPFNQAAGVSQDVASIVAADLTRSGQFSALPVSSLNKNAVANGFNADLAAQSGAEFAVFGDVSAQDNGYRVEFQLVALTGANKGKALAHFAGNSSNNLMRQAAHRVSDRVYEAVTGQKGCFRTRIAYVVTNFKAKYRYTLMTADYDGYNEVPVVKSTQPIMTPSWSPDGTRLVYVSFERRTPAIFVQNIKTKARRKLASFPGLNSSPSWSPDGTKIAMTLSKDGNPDIYYYDLASGATEPQRVTASPAIDTEPSWSSDSRAIYFTSDRGGKAQIYKFDFDSRKTTRVTYNQSGRNLSAKPIPGTTSLVVITQVNGFRVARVDSDGGIYMLTSSSLDESPSVAPNGSMVIYSTIYGGRKGLAIVSTDGRFKANLPSKSGEISSPAWGPLNVK